MEGFDTSLAEGLALMTPFDANASDEATQSFVAKFKEDVYKRQHQRFPRTLFPVHDGLAGGENLAQNRHAGGAAVAAVLHRCV